jgi:hypothetical protein
MLSSMKTLAGIPRGFHVRLPAGAIISLMSFLVAGCDGGGEGLAIPEDQVDAFLEAAIPGTADLPGTGWTITSEDEFDDSDEPAADSDACRALAAEEVEYRTPHDDNRVGRTTRDYEHANGVLVTVGMAVYDDDSHVEEILTAWSGHAGSQRSVDCVEAALAEDGIEAEGSLEAALATPPHGGYAAANAFTLRQGDESDRARLESYGWQVRNVGVIVNIFGESRLLTRASVSELVDAIAATVDGALPAD